MSGDIDLAVRRRLAEKISTVKRRAGLRTPIIDEIPLKAEVIESLDFPLPTTMGMIPVIAKGTAYGAEAGRWYRVTFVKPIRSPSVVCAGLARKGVVPEPPRIEPIPKLAEILEEALPKLELPSVPEKIGRFEIYFPWPLTEKGEELERMLNAMVEIVEKGLQRINDIIEKVDERLEKIRTTLNESLKAVSDRLETLRTGTNDRLLGLFPRLYGAWGLRADMAPTILNTRNVTDYGFEFLSMGATTAHWVAVGSRL